MDQHFDVIVVGTGAGGGTVARSLALAGKKVLILERGAFLPREKENWSTKAVFRENRYHTAETWQDADGKAIHPGTGYWVGGNTKVYGAALFRLREKDFGVLLHQDGVSPAWPLAYDEFEPYYARAESLFDVHGRAGGDPTEPPRERDFPFPPLQNEPRMAAIEASLRAAGLKPFPVPLALRRNDADPVASPCIRCETCDGFPCLVQAKADSEMNCIRPIAGLPNVTLITGAQVKRVLTDSSGRVVAGVAVSVGAEPREYRADVVVVACGAINSAALLLASATDAHPKGLANGSGLVGRHLMLHNSAAILAITSTPNDSRFMKTFGINDFYFGEPGYPFPMGSIQPIGSFQRDMLRDDAPPLTPGLVLDWVKNHAVPWWLMTEDLPDPENRVTLEGGQITLRYRRNNQESFQRLQARWTKTLKQSGHAQHVHEWHGYFKKTIAIDGVGHQNGTCRFGDDPQASVLDRNCQTHEVANLYVVDASFFPSCGAVNPSLTIIANALRVGDHLIERLA